LKINENIHSSLLDKHRLFVLFSEIILLVLHYFVSPYGDLILLSFTLGLASYIFIPGFLIVSNLKFLRSHRNVATDLSFGFSIPILVIAIFWGFHIEPVNFRLLFPIFLSFSVFVMLLLAPRGFLSEFRNQYLTKSILLILILAVAIRSIYFFANSSSIAIDGALYSDIARTIVSHGEFSSKILNIDPSIPYFNVQGFINYPLTVFSIATFFLIGGVSFASAKLAVFFIGCLLVLMIYKLSDELFGKKTALIAGMISAFMPLLSFYSSILYGPELLSALFVMNSLYFFLLGIKSQPMTLHSVPYMVLSGLFASMTFAAWGLIPFFTLMISLSLIYILNNSHNRKRLWLYSFSLFGIVFFAYKFSTIIILEMFLLCIPFFCLFILLKKGKLSMIGITIFASAVILALQLFFVHSYLAGQPYITGMEHIIVPLADTLKSDLIKSINPFFLPGGIHTDITYIVNSYERLGQSLTSILSPLIFGLFLASFFSPVSLREKTAMFLFPSISSLFFVLTFSSDQFWYGNTFSDRFLVLPVCFLIILSSTTINTLLRISRSFEVSTKIGRIKLSSRIPKLGMRKYFFAIIILVVTISLIPIHSSYVKNLDAGYANVANWYGKPTLNWIENSTFSTDVFCASDANRLAFFTDRVFVGTTSSSGSLDVSVMNNLIKQYKINYVIVDSFLIDYTPHEIFFDNLYQAPIELGQISPLLDKNSTSEVAGVLVSSRDSTIMKDFYGLKLVFEYSENSRTTRIFQVVNNSYSINVKLVDDTFQSWNVNRGNFSVGELGATVKTSKGNDWAYIFLNSSQTLPKSFSNSFLTIRLKGNDNSARFWTAMITEENNWLQIQSDISAPLQFQDYTYNLENTQGKNVTNIYLGVSGEKTTSVTYAWIILYNLVQK
jgi:hypothetical protein